MKRPVSVIMLSMFLSGVAFFFWFKSTYTTIDIQLAEGVGAEVLVKNIYVGKEVLIMAVDDDIQSQEVKWKIGDKWTRVRNPRISFDNEGETGVELYVDGKLRGTRIVDVLGRQVDIQLPVDPVQGSTYTLKDATQDAISRKWIIDGEEFTDANVKYTFKKSKKYPVKVYVTTADTTYLSEHIIDVRKKDAPKPQKPRERTTTIVQTDPEPPEDDPIDLPTPDVLVDESDNRTPDTTPDVTPDNDSFDADMANGFHEGLTHYDYDQTINIKWSEKPKESCLITTPDARTITLTDITENLCLTELYFVPGENRGNQVKITISNPKFPGSAKSVTRFVQSNRGKPSKVDVRDIGCGLAKNERYNIKVEPVGESQIAEIDTRGDCFTHQSYDFVRIDHLGNTKIINLALKRME